MSGSGEPGGKKAGRVEVIYFPKKVPSRKRTHTEAADLSESRTVEFRPFDEDPPRGKARVTPKETPAPARGRKGKDRRRRTPEAQPRRTRSAERRITVEIDTDPALRYHAQKLEELVAAASPADPLKSMDRMELAQMALFGHQLFESGRLDEARVVFEGLVGLDVPDAFPHTMLGTVYLALGHPDRAAALFEAALHLDPQDLAARVYQAEIRISQGRHKPAVAALQAVVKGGPPQDPFVDRARRLLQIVRDQQRR